MGLLVAHTYSSCVAMVMVDGGEGGTNSLVIGDSGGLDYHWT